MPENVVKAPLSGEVPYSVTVEIVLPHLEELLRAAALETVYGYEVVRLPSGELRMQPCEPLANEKVEVPDA